MFGRLDSLGKLKRESFEFQNSTVKGVLKYDKFGWPLETFPSWLKEYDKFSLPSERSVIKTLNDDARQSYGFVLVAIWSSESDVFDYCMNSVRNL